jgi:hypothetical protein
MLMCSWLLAAHHRELTVVRREASLAIVMTVDLSRLVLDLVSDFLAAGSGVGEDLLFLVTYPFCSQL